MTVNEEYSEWPHMGHYSDIPLFNTKAVVQQTGVAAPTLRAWERRYTILSPERGDNDYRLYSERDVMMIRWLKNRVDSGMSISQAIALFRHRSAEEHRLQETQMSVRESTSGFHVSLPDTMLKHQAFTSEEQNSIVDESVQLPPENSSQIGVEQTSDSYLIVYNMRAVRENLVSTFKVMDEATAHNLMASMLAIYPVEQICTELIVPTLWQIGQLWSEGKITVSVEHFASAFFRGLLSNLLHVTPYQSTGPLVFACCAPGEPHELAPLMLALFLRRAGVRVAYLGQSIESDGLLQTIKQLTPALICVSLTMPAHLAPLIDLAQQIEALPAPRPLFAFGGQVFVHYTHLVTQVPGTYISGDMNAMILQLKSMLSSRTESRS